MRTEDPRAKVTPHIAVNRTVASAGSGAGPPSMAAPRLTPGFNVLRALRACRVIHYSYDLWATEVFASERPLGRGAPAAM